MEQVCCGARSGTMEPIATQRMGVSKVNDTDEPDVWDVPPTFAPNAPPTGSHRF